MEMRFMCLKLIYLFLFSPVIVHATFGVRTNALTKEELRPDSHSSALIAAAYEANSLTLKLDQQLPVWKIWHTPLYQRYERCLDLLHVEGERLLKRWRDNKEVERCLMDDYVKEPTLTEKGERNGTFATVAKELPSNYFQIY